ncbi:MAG: hypothetical protein KatS3mg011_1403 [Acidimicrobiia bacterium]|nr:MAG: hypothetical protein KatS3mg011_1403 [Acidimicrobiia bacterium]
MQEHATRPDVVLLGLEGLRVLAAAEHQGELLLLVETTQEVVGCPRCGTRARSKGRRETRGAGPAGRAPPGAAPVEKAPLGLSRW